MPAAVIIGAGVFGSALAHRLALDAWDVTLVEQESPGWDGSASGGESRLLRFSHGHEAWYARSARRSRELWREIDPAVFVECGVAWFAYRDDGWEADSERVLISEGIPVDRLEPAQAARLFPSLGCDDLAWVLFESEAGVLRADRAVKALVTRGREAGVRVITGRATPEGDHVRIGDQALEADRIIWACGPWLGKHFPGLAPVRATRQEVVFFEAGPAWSSPPAPGWVDYDASFYGHGDLGGLGVKIASDAEGPAMDPDDASPSARSSEAYVREYLARRFPGLGDAPIHHTRPCPYELTADTHFVAAPHPEHPDIWLMGGGSGHGFKHAPALAERMAAWLRGEPSDPRFALGSRDIDRSLRTAGARATPIGRRPPEAGS